MKKIFILQGNGDSDSFCGALATAYERGARLAGHDVRRINIGDLTFDPVLHKGYKVIQSLEPDLVRVQNEIAWCNHFVLFYPMWWSAMPALLKGMIDRMWLPGFAYHFNKNGMGWRGLLHGRSARIVMTMDAWPLLQRLLFGDSTNEIARAVLKFSGFHPVNVKKIGSVEHMTDIHKNGWFQTMEKWGRSAR